MMGKTIVKTKSFTLPKGGTTADIYSLSTERLVVEPIVVSLYPGDSFENLNMDERIILDIPLTSMLIQWDFLENFWCWQIMD